MSKKDYSGVCDRCGDEFRCKNGYKMIDLIDRPCDIDLELKNAFDKHLVLCRSCTSDFRVWMVPGINSKKELAKYYKSKMLDRIE